MQKFAARCAIDCKRALGEGAIWSHRQNRLLWVDIVRGKLFRFDPSTASNESWDIRQMAGTVVERAGSESEVVLATTAGICAYDLDTSTVTEVLAANPEAGDPRCFSNRFNDGKCDPAGRLWAGTMDVHCAADKGTLYRFDQAEAGEAAARTKLAATAVVQPATIPNGIVWTRESDAMSVSISPSPLCLSLFALN